MLPQNTGSVQPHSRVGGGTGWGIHRLCATPEHRACPAPYQGGAQVGEYTDYVLPQNTGSVQPHSRVWGGGAQVGEYTDYVLPQNTGRVQPHIRGGHRLGNTQIMCYPRTQGVSSPIAGWGGGGAQVGEYTDYVLPQNTGRVQPHIRGGHRLGNTQIMCYPRTQGVSSPIAGCGGGAQVGEYTDYVLPQNTGSVQPHSRVGGGAQVGEYTDYVLPQNTGSVQPHSRVGGGTGWGIHRLCATPEHRECPAP